MNKINILILVISLVIFIADIKTFKYSCPNVYPILLIHHIVVMFILFGFLYSDKTVLLIYLILPFILVGHWVTNDNNCIITQIASKQCENATVYRGFEQTIFPHLAKNIQFLIISKIIYPVGWLIALYKYIH